MLTLLIILILLGIMAFGAFFIVMFFRWAFFGDKIKAKKMERYKQRLPQRFNGADTVTWDLPNYSDAPTKDQLISDATQAGYRLDHISSGRYEQTLVFAKQPTLEERIAPYMEERN